MVRSVNYHDELIARNYFTAVSAISLYFDLPLNGFLVWESSPVGLRYPLKKNNRFGNHKEDSPDIGCRMTHVCHCYFCPLACCQCWLIFMRCQMPGYNVVLSSCENSSQWQVASALLFSGIQCDTATWYLLLYRYCKTWQPHGKIDSIPHHCSLKICQVSVKLIL